MTDILQRLQNVGNIAFEDINDAIAEITRLRAASKWQPIETAPKDWNEILVWDGISIRVVKHAYDDEHGNPKWAPEGLPFLYATHWQPLPSPPTQEGGE